MYKKDEMEENECLVRSGPADTVGKMLSNKGEKIKNKSWLVYLFTYFLFLINSVTA